MTFEQFLSGFDSVPWDTWQAAFDAMTPDQRSQVDDVAAQRAITYARISAYVSSRSLGATHAEAVRRQNKTARQVRRALGFSYPDCPVTF